MAVEMSVGETFDVVVVGSGGGALVGAYLAQRAGLRTVVVERTAYVGGTSAYSGGACWLPGSHVQHEAGLPDSTDSARTYLDHVLGEVDAGRRTRLEAFLAEAPRLVRALTDDGTFAFEWTPFPEYFDVPGRVPGGRSIQPSAVKRTDLPAEVAALVRPPVERDRVGREGRSTLSGGQALIARALAGFLREGGTVRTGHRMTDLLVEDDRVVGVVAVTPDGPVELRAERGVLLAAGGFEGNAELRTARGVPGDAAWTMAPAGTNAGEPIEAGVRAGAATDLLAEGWFCPGMLHPDGRGSFVLAFRSGLMVDRDGRRYANESLPYDRFGREMARAAERVPSWFVFDASEGGRIPAIAMPEGDPEEHLAAGTRVRADSIGELARLIGATELEATVARFNEHAATGHDPDFGRGEDEYDTFFAGGGGPGAVLKPLDRGPFYAAKFVLCDLGTKGGLVTDEHARVLRADGSPIAGLYASANSAASVVGATYPAPGVPLGTAMVFASLAVQDLLQASAVSAETVAPSS